jgi:PAS domain S-box-containing protein
MEDAVFLLEATGADTGRILDANPAAEAMTGYSREELRHLNITDLDTPESRAKAPDRLERMRRGEWIREEVTHRRKDGGLNQVEVTAGLMPVGDRSYILAIDRDVTQRRREGEARRESEARLATIFRETPAIMAINTFRRGDFLDVNPAFQRALGHPREEVLGKSIFRLDFFVLRQDRIRFGRILREHGEVRGFETPLATRSGQVLQALISSVPVTMGGVRCVLSVISDITSLRRSEKALRESEARHRSVVETSPNMVFLLDRHLTILYANPAAVRDLGSEGSLVGTAILGHIPSGLRRRVEADLRSARNRPGELHRRDTEFLTARGQRLPVELKSVGQAEAGETALVVIASDRRADMQRQALLQRLDRQKAAVVALATLPEWQEGKVEAIAPRVAAIAAEAVGTDRVGVWLLDEAAGRYRCQALFSRDSGPLPLPDDLPVAGYVRYLATLAAERALGVADAATDPRLAELWEGYCRPLGIVSLLDAPIRVGGTMVGMVRHEQRGTARPWHEDEIGFAGQVADQVAQALVIAHRIRSEEELRHSEERYSFALEATNDGLFDWNNTTDEIYVNERYAAMLGYCSADLPRNFPQLRALIHPDDLPRVEEVVGDHLQGNTPSYEVEFRLRRKDASWLWILSRGKVVVRDGSGKPLRTVGVNVDISERRRLEEERQLREGLFQQSMKLQALGQLAGGIAHDFNNFLTPIFGQVDLLLMGQPEERVRRRLLEIRKAAERARDMTAQLLTFGRRRGTQRTPMKLCRMLHEFETLLRHTIRENIEIRISCDPAAGPIHGDAAQLEQVVMNLAINAQDAMPLGGVMLIEVSDIILDGTFTRRHGQVLVGPFVVLSVGDTGMGMDEETLDHIFEPFYTTKEPGKGTGLGLASVYGIVREHEGHIWAYSEPGKGTTFKIFFPRLEDRLPEAAMAAPAAPLPPVEGGHETILVVEDSHMVRTLACEILRENGYRVLEAPDPATALEMVHRGLEPMAEILLTDVIMPGMNGKELFERLQVLHPDLRVLFMSAYSSTMTELLEGLPPKGGYIQKPFAVATLLAKIREILAK